MNQETDLQGCTKSFCTGLQRTIGNYLGILQAGCLIIGSLKLTILAHIGPQLLKKVTCQGFFFFFFFPLLRVTLPVHQPCIFSYVTWTALLANHAMALKYDLLMSRIIIVFVCVLRSTVSGKHFMTFSSFTCNCVKYKVPCNYYLILNHLLS